MTNSYLFYSAYYTRLRVKAATEDEARAIMAGGGGRPEGRVMADPRAQLVEILYDVEDRWRGMKYLVGFSALALAVAFAGLWL